MRRSCMHLAVWCLLLAIEGAAGSNVNPPDNRGTDFVLMFMENKVLNYTFQLELYVTTQENKDVKVHITSPKWTSPFVNERFTVKAGSVHKVLIDPSFRMYGNGISNKSLHVTADAEVVCYGSNKESLSNDVYLGIPTDALGTEYYAMTYSPAEIKSEIGIAATADKTDVKITLPKTNGDLNVTFQGRIYKQGDQIQVTLDKFETLQIQSSGDLTGTHITSDKPVAVFSGNIKTRIGKGQFSDHLVEQMTSVDRWGTQFVTAPIPKRTVGDVFKLIARDDNTVIKIPGMKDLHLNAGESTTFELPSDTYNFVNSSRPILLTQFVKGQQSPNEPADPSMMIVPPYELFGSDYTFTTPEYSHPEYGNLPQYRYENQFMVVADESEKDGLLMDGKPFPANVKWTKIPGTKLVGTFITVPHGSHMVRHVNPLSIFGGYLYGHAYHESYAFPTGMRLAKLHDKNCIPTPSIPGDGIDNDCDNKIDEELCTPENQGKDDDGDGKSDEDCVKVMPVDGLWASWEAWAQCSVSCGDGIQIRHRNCSAPEPKFGGNPCPGNSSESKPCYAGTSCPINIKLVCKLNKTAVVANPTNCAQYYDCNQLSSSLGQEHLLECQYPKLFSLVTFKCEDFDVVNCTRRPVPVDPCDYIQNQCNGSDPNCQPCTSRLPNCVGSPDGANPFSQAVTFGPEYKVCFQNRTVDIKNCAVGYFNPQAKKCLPHNPGTLSFYCRQHPTALLGHPNSCGKFYNCSKSGNSLKAKEDECLYPELFSTTTKKCENFTDVVCDARKEPQEPCEYDQNLCPSRNTTCPPCPHRHANCKSLGNGTQPFSGKMWSSNFATCLLNRTINQSQCTNGFYHPVELTCKDVVRQNESADVCKANVGKLFASSNNCAQYFDCSGNTTGSIQPRECKYPDLFSPEKHDCQNFDTVNCTTRNEPQAPCEYMQNICNVTTKNCTKCPQRMPSCVGKSDGYQAFPNRLWKPDYIQCYKNRTLNVTKCSEGYFHLNLKKCLKDVSRTDAIDYCSANRVDIVPTTDNCAQFFNCSQRKTSVGDHVMECNYPDLFSVKTLSCENFETVQCNLRLEPQAPCEYIQNICNVTRKNCTKCPRRLPSCVGKNDGYHVFPTRLWKPDYIQCYKNRTLNITKCKEGYFHPNLNKCLKDLSRIDAVDYCSANQADIVPTTVNCAQFFNCSQRNTSVGDHVMECRYPDLFSVSTLSCEDFQNVQCNARLEPQAPCEYQQNMCNGTDPSCKTCPFRLPSCVGLPDGLHEFPTRRWKPNFIVCYKNRTTDIKKCPNGYFHPRTKNCTKEVHRVDAVDYCSANRADIVPTTDNCAEYFNCSKLNTSIGDHVVECHYPDLFSVRTLSCESFETVQCNTRSEPQAPCNYTQSLCNKMDPLCEVCPSRLPSCVGVNDGNHAFPKRLWKLDYITCYKNRTTNITKCNSGYFHPKLNLCTNDVLRVDANDYCSSNPTDIIPTPDNCAQYYNCSQNHTEVGNHVMECTYPDLFSTVTSTCVNFTSVSCTKGREPQAPCEYIQNHCNRSNSSCLPCPVRLHSCVGLPDGDNAVPGGQWTPEYISCYKNRTMAIQNCKKGNFDPVTRVCSSKIDQSNIDSICKSNPTAVIAMTANCAKYYNCSANSTGHHVHECTYPDLFSVNTNQCQDFETVTCQNRFEPMAPCQYDKNQCSNSDPYCIKCPLRLPSCIGLQDGNNTFPTRLWKPDYIKCYKNRTLDIRKCADGYFHPNVKNCLKDVQRVDAIDYCAANQNDILPTPGNCAQYYNCSDRYTHLGDHVMECKYPDLFSFVNKTCQNFETVVCSNRSEPQAPCSYQQNICNGSDLTCEKCPLRLPSCIGLSDGNHAFPTRLWNPDYIVCFKNRTLSIDRCQNGYFHPRTNLCKNDVASVDSVDYCAANPSDIIPVPENCAQYYNCSAGQTDIGNHTMECKYPDLFSVYNLTCQNFETIQCKTRMEPQAPCEYHQNLCNSSDSYCKKCLLRLPSCIGLPDGSNEFSSRLWKPDYIVCYRNRTISITKCPKGYFHPRKKTCTMDVLKVDAKDYCSSNPTDIISTPDNCAQYYNCSQSHTELDNHVVECNYPDLFSTVTFTCENFTSVSCTKRREPQAPCDYTQHHCNHSNSLCKPCSTRFHSCVGLPDGDNAMPNGQWIPEYISCYKNRTMETKHCKHGNFDPVTMACTSKIDHSNIDRICKAKPNAVIAMPSNCAKYYNCSANSIGHHLHECTYPDLFSVTINRCQPFENVACQNRSEPMAPCQYDKNHCNQSDLHCLKCPLRLPSCIGLQDGNNPFPTRLWKPDYVKCYKNRTLDIRKCADGYYHPTYLKHCTKDVQKVDAVDYCAANLNDILPTPDNCAQYYNCSDRYTHIGDHVIECKYPDLFSAINKRCQNFETVVCSNRSEPQAPCSYQRNICNESDPTCEKCPLRLPSCIGLSDGKHSFPTRLWKPDYMVCYKNRTLSIDRCQDGYFHPRTNMCTKDVASIDVKDYCSSNPMDVIPTPDNCAQYYNCSRNHTEFDDHVIECKYPDLFSTVTSTCENFTVVSCMKRREPQAPCDYNQNHCNSSNPLCKPCSTRLHSCVGLPDGDNTITSGQWIPEYISCFKNRTMETKHCKQGNFDPVTRVCTSKVDQTNIDSICKSKPTALIAMSSNCAKYYNCSANSTGHHILECTYPDLYSVTASRCQSFEDVTCHNRSEPMAPCQYDQNHCNQSDPHCLKCHLRLPSCIGLQDGNNPFPTRMWKPDYIQCYKNRTLDIRKCADGYFHPNIKYCSKDVKKVDALDYCAANQNHVLPKADSCAQYYNCSDRYTNIGDHVMECRYPDLFSAVNKKCQNFETVVCSNRSEPQAPCQYENNLCNASQTVCLPCPLRLPSCVGLNDGVHPFATRMWKPDFITCYKNRTLGFQKCPEGYFHPIENTCRDNVNRFDAKQFCAANPSAILPTTDNCAQYYNCSAFGSVSMDYIQECKYPDLFSSLSFTCQDFTTVRCDKRSEPQAPCEYNQNICPPQNSSCEPCDERLPSCTGMGDGNQPVMNRLWKDIHVGCYRNRTLAVRYCPNGAVFNPRTKQCVSKIPSVDVVDFCRSNPGAVKAHETNCAQFYNCSDRESKYGDFLQECYYPDLFSSVYLRCLSFENISCGSHYEPMQPCEYLQNLCNKSEQGCTPCTERLQSCIGLPNGPNPIQNRLWKPEFITCFKNRTIAVEQCHNRYFHPLLKKCIDPVNRVDVPEYCMANPNVIVRAEDNCAQYYNCSLIKSDFGSFVAECKYPDLFSDLSMSCETFNTTNCNVRQEPQSPCEYDQNMCNKSNSSCIPCSKRLPNCVGLPNGFQPIPFMMWSDAYSECYENRTISILHCINGYFHPRTKKCLTDVDPVDVPEYCDTYPDRVFANVDNCAKYINCSSKIDGFQKECQYPDLYSEVTNKCEKFTFVSCGRRSEPQAPCQYDQNLCDTGSKDCVSCPDRLPSCIGKDDGLNVFPGKYWQSDFIKCFKNRTVAVDKCVKGFLHPVLRHCEETVLLPEIPDYCDRHPTDVLPNPQNCAQFFNCSMIIGAEPFECVYPDLYSIEYNRCMKFTRVVCNTRTEPQAPCEYQQNLCLGGNYTCLPCPERLPSCVYKEDGVHPFTGLEWTKHYITCYKNRTVGIDKCPEGSLFHPEKRGCITQLNTSDVQSYCKNSKDEILEHPSNCALYFNCSTPITKYGPYTSECDYPKLFSPELKLCVPYKEATCKTKYEPMAPCEYLQSLCEPNIKDCKPCDERLPSCVGRQNGPTPVPGKEWMSQFVICKNNRTIFSGSCKYREYFHPVKRICTDKVQPVDVSYYCPVHKLDILPDPRNCGRFFNCSSLTSNFSVECQYPDLFAEELSKCITFENVSCNERPEPQAPCNYTQNLCSALDKSCSSCPERFPSCIGLPDGNNGLNGRLWKSEYIICYKNRTTKITECPGGHYFNPRKRSCENVVTMIDVPAYCSNNKDDLLPSQNNCAQYYNCSDSSAPKGEYQECHYPDLFSSTSSKCDNFDEVKCGARHEPVTPCEYEQNICGARNVSCLSCPERLPSCKELSDGYHVFGNQTWTNRYIECYKKRTVSIHRCPVQQIFHPKQLKCVLKFHGDDLLYVCHKNRNRVLPHPNNCAQYYNCTAFGGTHLSECKYPSLFDEVAERCQKFTKVKCGDRTEPQAPCDYKQFLCTPQNTECTPCPQRMPSCIGMKNGLQPFPAKRWHREFIECYNNRTVNVDQCEENYVFNPFIKSCVQTVHRYEIPDYCNSNPAAVMPDSEDCSRYYNCSSVSFHRNYRHQCAYPDLFSELSNRCVPFNLVTCNGRKEPMEPCLYGINVCKDGDKKCIPCIERLPSCVNLTNGNNGIAGKLWSSKYIICMQNRTLGVKTCAKGIFDPNTRTCRVDIDPKNIDNVCRANRNRMFEHETNCAQYFNCSALDTVLGHYLMECPYPLLYDTQLQTCRNFSEVSCSARKEPQSPCEYLSNRCLPGNKSCQRCSERLPNCVGKTDGPNSFETKPWSRYYVICYRNRTLSTKTCREGFFNPNKRICTKILQPVDVTGFCEVNPEWILPDEENCGKYINCSAAYNQWFSECPYPQLYSEASQGCQNFTSVYCGKRPEPQAPCEYDQNQCPSNKPCNPCHQRLPSCRGLPDGRNAIPGHHWTSEYVECNINRTVGIKYCDEGLFDPETRICINTINHARIDEVCRANPSAIFPDPSNCARYFDCAGQQYSNNYERECKYPDLFSATTRRCLAFSNVSCGDRFEPQAPCEYMQNLCKSSSHCIPCTERLPSCIGLPNGFNSIEWRRWTDRYISCFRNRTAEVRRCTEGVFNPISKTCVRYIPKEHIKDFCRSLPFSVLPNGLHAAQFFDCSSTTLPFSTPYLQECPYPKLFDEQTLQCKDFTKVSVGKRPVPQEPCDYEQNLCKPTDGPECLRCGERLFSCVGHPDGDNAIEGKFWEPVYIVCFKNRTLLTEECKNGVFDPVKRKCVMKTDLEYVSHTCKLEYSKLFQHPSSCSLYYNCSVSESHFGTSLPVQLRECPYPQLFSTDFNKCMDFQSVRCGERHEVQAPCEYMQNQCKLSDTGCIPCLMRLPSCIGLLDGDYPLPGHLWEDTFAHCFKNRTLAVQKCSFGFYFHPYKRQCQEVIIKVDVHDYCNIHPHAVIPSAENCAQYYNCSIHAQYRIQVGRNVANQECHYPNLFSSIQRRCDAFTKVNCGKRYEPKQPCEYETNRCPVNGETGCVPCEERLPSCDGLPDGNNAIPGKEYTQYYVDCYINRTMSKKKCENAFFDPDLRICVKDINSGNIMPYCQRDYQAVLPHPDNCAWFYNCSVTGLNSHSVYPYDIIFAQECPYPMLFSKATMRCEPYQRVICGTHFEPQSPCEYVVNRCDPTEIGCIPCPNRIPSCKTLADGFQIVNNLFDGLDYLVNCENNRTNSYERCTSQLAMCSERLTQKVTTPTSAVTDITSTIRDRSTTYSKSISSRPTDRSKIPAEVSSLSISSVYSMTEKVTSPPVFVNTYSPLPLLTTSQSGVVQGICRKNVGLLLGNPLHCGQFYNCSRQAAPYLFECPYPQMFDDNLHICRPFEQVLCGERTEYVAPCEYQQNICSFGDVNCIPCIEKFPSCRGLAVGNHPFRWRLWSPDYFTCYRNRTVYIGHCEKGVFDPNRMVCISTVTTDNVATYCSSNPSGVLPSPANCAQYFQCSDIYKIGAKLTKECSYPLLFHPVMKTCADYNMVQCEKRYEPMTPCDYETNQCDGGGCVPCEQRFVSCLGKSDGQHVFPGKEYTPLYVRCHRNRTVAVEECGGGIFDPMTRQCTLNFGTASVSHFCGPEPGQVKAHPLNCAQFVDCGVTDYLSLNAITECPYPKLFSQMTLRCEDFEGVQCGPRHEPKAPCEYLQNLCNGTDLTCKPCIERLPSCIGLPDGHNPVVNRTWLAQYIYCYKERTLEVLTCPQDTIFDPYLKKCVTDNIQPTCADTPTAVIPNPDNCAQFYNCTNEETLLGHYLMECPYPQLFNENSGKCIHYKDIECGTRFEPKSPCEYELNQCLGPHCKPCYDRYPSCYGKPDGLNPYPGRELTGYYIVCEQGRLVDTGICIVDKILDPTRRICTRPSDEEIVNAFCAANPGAVIASLTNCAQFYECGVDPSEPAHYRQECVYPQLFSMVDHTCKHFSEVQCGQRDEPIAPCDYEQYQCLHKDPSCIPCQQRMPSCVGLPDGKNTYPNSVFSYQYLVCEEGRTINIDKCLSGYFDPDLRDCVLFPSGLVPSIYSAGVCNDHLISGTNGIPDKSITASTVYGLSDKTTNYGPERGRLNTVETKDPAGVTQIGAWVAEKGNLNQWIQVELKDLTLIRGVVTQGRNGCCKQWVSKYRVLYSMDCHNWTTVGDFNVTDAFFKANSDEDTPVTNMFHCPVLAKCIRINPLDWKNQIAMRLDLIGCPIGNSQQTASPTTTAGAPAAVTNKLTPTAAPITSPMPVTTRQPVTSAVQSTTQGGVVVVSSGAVNTKSPGSGTTPKSGTLSGGKKNCITSCQGKPNGDYASCKGCDVFITCNWYSMYPDRPCPKGLKWDDNKKQCLYKSSTCP